MQYVSTRNATYRVSSMEAIKLGISMDGGLFVPEEIPSLPIEKLMPLLQSSYQERAVEILKLFLTDYAPEDLKFCTDQAYRSDNFSSPRIAPVKNLGSGLHVQELWHGPTAAFKDMALQILPLFLTMAIEKTGENSQILILAATSGDTGKAALEGFKDVPGTRILVFYPQEGVSALQRLQMITQEGGNLKVSGVYGNFDDTQSGVKGIFTDPVLKQELAQKGYRFSSANSINWGRLVPQIVYYYSAYLDLLQQGSIELGEEINVVVPTGNFGNILAAYYAKKMGLPLHKLICASNDNHVLTDFIRTGIYDRRRQFVPTLSPSMDILISSNLERLLFELAGRDDAQVVHWMHELTEHGVYGLEGEALEQLVSLFWGGYATEDETRRAIRNTYETRGYTLDPHTAVGMHVYDRYKEETGDERQTLLISTASPFKFPKDVLLAITAGGPNNREETDLLVELAKVSSTDMPAPLLGLKDKEVLHREVCGKDEMRQAVMSFINAKEE